VLSGFLDSSAAAAKSETVRGSVETSYLEREFAQSPATASAGLVGGAGTRPSLPAVNEDLVVTELAV